MRFSKQIMTVAAFSILSCAAIAHAGDACKNVKFKFTNKHDSGGTIELHQIKYFNKANGAWQTEDLNDIDCKQGKTCTTLGNNLKDSEGEDLTKIRLIYRYKGVIADRLLILLVGTTGFEPATSSVSRM